jgi:hypothetical protein
LIVITQSKLTLKEIFGDLLKHKTNQFVDWWVTNVVLEVANYTNCSTKKNSPYQQTMVVVNVVDLAWQKNMFLLFAYMPTTNKYLKGNWTPIPVGILPITT